MTELLELRPEVAAFAQLMERELRANDRRKGAAGWKSCTPRQLVPRVTQEARELADAVEFAYTPDWSTKRPDFGWYGGWLVREKDGVTEYASPHTASWKFNPTYLDHSRKRIGSEAADVANMAMMVADVCGALSQARSTDEGTSAGKGEHASPDSGGAQ